LIDKMPKVFRDPLDDLKSTNSAYYMIVGEGSFGDSKEGRQLAEITDEASATLMMIQSKRDIPWTKPEDAVIQATKPIPELGGFLNPDGTFLACFVDGGIRIMDDAVSFHELRGHATIAGGELVH